MSDHGHNRRQFFQRAALGIAGATLAGAVPGPAATGNAQQARGYPAGRFFLTLDGVKCGFVRTAQGGSAYSEVLTQPGPETYATKQLGPVRYDPVTIEADFGVAGPLFDWIAASWMQSSARKNGAVIAADYNYTAKTQRDFFNAVITETTIPAMDASSKDPAALALTFQPEYTRLQKASGKLATAMAKAQKVWLPTNFRLEIDGLDCKKVSKIDAFTIKQVSPADATGEHRDFAKDPGLIEFPNLAIYVDAQSADSWYAWHDNFVVKGNNGSEQEKNGALVFLTANLQTELARVTFHHLGIFRLSDEKRDAGASAINRIRAELYCQRMEFSYNAAVVG